MHEQQNFINVTKNCSFCFSERFLQGKIIHSKEISFNWNTLKLKSCLQKHRGIFRYILKSNFPIFNGIYPLESPIVHLSSCQLKIHKIEPKLFLETVTTFLYFQSILYVGAVSVFCTLLLRLNPLVFCALLPPVSCKNTSNFIKNDTLTQLLSREFCKIFKNTFFIEHLKWLLLESRFHWLECLSKNFHVK